MADGITGRALGSSALLVHARSREINDVPSPRAWLMRKTAADAASEVGKSRRWSSHSGLDLSMGRVDRGHVVLQSLVWVGLDRGGGVQVGDDDVVVKVHRGTDPSMLGPVRHLLKFTSSSYPAYHFW
jgi:hypothetical protein